MIHHRHRWGFRPNKEGIIRYRRVYSVQHLPDMEEIVRVLQQLAASSPTEGGQQG
jgi:hypothetical protein